jgi:hypothetical protein
MAKKSTMKKLQGRLAALNRRADFLKERIKTRNDIERSGYDIDELRAIEWAIHLVEKCPFEALSLLNVEVPFDEIMWDEFPVPESVGGD